MSMIPKMISGILAAILIAVVLYATIPSVWFWIGFEVLAALLVAIGCSGEWYLHHHPAGRRRKEKDEHHKLESRFIAAVVVGVFMEFFSLGHAIPEAIRLENDVAVANLEAKRAGTNAAASYERAAVAERESGQANERAAKFDADRVMVEKEAEEIRSTNFVLHARVLELEARMQDRTITAGDRDKFINLLKDIPRGIVECYVDGNSDAETQNYAEDIRQMIKSAGYDVSALFHSGIPGFGSPSFPKGIVIGCESATNQAPFAGPIQRAFKAIGIDAIGNVGEPTGTNTIRIYVGRRP